MKMDSFGNFNCEHFAASHLTLMGVVNSPCSGAFQYYGGIQIEDFLRAIEFAMKITHYALYIVKFSYIIIISFTPGIKS